MKNYPHLYTPVNNKKAQFSNQIKTHKKSTSIVGNQTPQYSKLTSNRTINHIQSSINRRNNKYPRISSRSIQQIQFDRSSEDNYNCDLIDRKNLLFQNNLHKPQYYYPMPTFGQYVSKSGLNQILIDNYSYQSNQDAQLFQKSYQKIGQIKYQVHNKNIDHQLNQVLELIKQQKLRANQTVKTLKKTADHYKKICQNVTKTFLEKSTNTQQIIPYMKQTQCKDKQTQYFEIQQHFIQNRQSSPTFAKIQKTETKNTEAFTQSNNKKQQNLQKPVKQEISRQKVDGKQIQIYKKLATMLQDMNINSRQILPQDIKLNFEVKNYKVLSEGQIIKIQKFFIKKLVQKIPK